MRRRGAKGKSIIMSFRNLYPIICVLLCFASLSCAPKSPPKNKKPLKQRVISSNSEQFLKAIALLDVEAVSNHLDSGVDANARKSDKTALMLAVITPYFLPSQEDKEKISSGQNSREEIINERRKRIIQNLIEKGADIDATDKHNKTALMLAITVTEKSFDYRKELLGIEINISDGQKISDPDSTYHNLDIWITHMSEDSTFQISQTLIEAGANVNIADRYGRTPLMSITETFFLTIPPIAQTLINAGADVNATDKSGRTAFIQLLIQMEQALKSDNSIRTAMLAETVEILLRERADMNATDENGRKALEIILDLSKSNRSRMINSIVETFIDNIDLNAVDATSRDQLITHIFRNGNNKGVETIFHKDKGINVNFVNEDGKTPLIQLLEMVQQEPIPNMIEMLTSLIEAGADVHATDEYGNPPLIIVLKLAKEKIEEIEFDMVEVIRLLIDAEADVNFRNEGDNRYEGWTPLMFASSLPPLSSSSEYKLDIVKMLLEANADPNARDNKHWTVLMIASANLNPNDPASEDIVEELLKKEADPNIVNHLWTALMFAARSGSINTVRTLIDYGAKADIVLQTLDQGPRSPFICARYVPKNRLDIEDLLITAGAGTIRTSSTKVCENDSYMQF